MTQIQYNVKILITAKVQNKNELMLVRGICESALNKVFKNHSVHFTPIRYNKEHLDYGTNGFILVPKKGTEEFSSTRFPGMPRNIPTSRAWEI